MGTNGVVAFGCGDSGQAVVWLLRRGPFEPDGRLHPRRGGPVSLRVPGLTPGKYHVVLWDTQQGRERGQIAAASTGNGVLATTLPWLGGDLALAVRAA